MFISSDLRTVARNVMVAILEMLYHVTFRTVQLLYMVAGVIGRTVLALRHAEVELKLGQEHVPIHHLRMVAPNATVPIMKIMCNATLRLALLLSMEAGVIGPTATVLQRVVLELKLAQGPVPIHHLKMAAHSALVAIQKVGFYAIHISPAKRRCMEAGVIGPTVLVPQHAELELKLAQEPVPIHHLKTVAHSVRVATLKLDYRVTYRAVVVRLILELNVVVSMEGGIQNTSSS